MPNSTWHPTSLLANASFDVDAIVQAAVGDEGRNRHRGPLPGTTNFNETAQQVKGCLNSTVLEDYVRGLVRNATTLSRAKRREVEGDPLVYIVAVLLFYSCGIAVLMINYMKKARINSLH